MGSFKSLESTRCKYTDYNAVSKSGTCCVLYGHSGCNVDTDCCDASETDSAVICVNNICDLPPDILSGHEPAHATDKTKDPRHTASNGVPIHTIDGGRNRGDWTSDAPPTDSNLPGAAIGVVVVVFGIIYEDIVVVEEEDEVEEIEQKGIERMMLNLKKI